MSDFYKARLAATFSPEGRDEVMLIRHNHLLAEPPTLEWSLQTASYEYIAHTWAGDLPTGNARLTLAAQPLIRANTRASLERKLRRLELELNLHRVGTLLLEEGFSEGTATLHTWWHAVVETANATPLPLEEAPPIPGAWGKLELSIILTNPSLENPLSRQSSEGAEEDDPNPENPDNPGSQEDNPGSQEDNPGSQEDNPGSQEDNPGSQDDPQPQYATGWIQLLASPLADIGLHINGTHITAPNNGLTAPDWAELINAANCGVTAQASPDWDDPSAAQANTVLITATAPGADGLIPLQAEDQYILLSGQTLNL